MNQAFAAVRVFLQRAVTSKKHSAGRKIESILDFIDSIKYLQLPLSFDKNAERPIVGGVLVATTGKDVNVSNLLD